MSSKHVLIIDNRVKTRSALLRLFTELGCEAMITRDEATGLAAAQHGEFDLVILGSDMRQSASAGELLRTLSEHNPDLVVLAIDGNGTVPAVSRSRVRELAPPPVAAPEPPDDPRAPYPIASSLRDVEKVHIERVLQYKRWNQSAAAQALGIDRKTLRSKMREFRLEKAE